MPPIMGAVVVVGQFCRVPDPASRVYHEHSILRSRRRLEAAATTPPRSGWRRCFGSMVGMTARPSSHGVCDRPNVRRAKRSPSSATQSTSTGSLLARCPARRCRCRAGMQAPIAGGTIVGLEELLRRVSMTLTGNAAPGAYRRRLSHVARRLPRAAAGCLVAQRLARCRLRAWMLLRRRWRRSRESLLRCTTLMPTPPPDRSRLALTPRSGLRCRAVIGAAGGAPGWFLPDANQGGATTHDACSAAGTVLGRCLRCLMRSAVDAGYALVTRRGLCRSVLDGKRSSSRPWTLDCARCPICPDMRTRFRIAAYRRLLEWSAFVTVVRSALRSTGIMLVTEMTASVPVLLPDQCCSDAGPNLCWAPRRVRFGTRTLRQGSFDLRRIGRQ